MVVLNHGYLGYISTFITVVFAVVTFAQVVPDSPCGSPAVPPNARARLSDGGLTVTYECDAGYELFGGATFTCSGKTKGKWQGELPFCATNVGYRKPANQSSSVRGGAAVNGNDGNRSPEHDGRHCTETLKEASPWWSVDLLRPYPVRVVRITTRGCCGQQPLQDLEIRVGNSSTDLQRNPLCAWYPGTVDEGVTKSFTCARPVIGQWVAIQLVGVEAAMSLCEVEVFTSDEFSADSCAPAGSPADLQISSFSRTCYEFGVTKGGSFTEARTQCQKHGGDLVHAFDGAAQKFVLSELERRKDLLKTQLVWIGAQKEPGLTSRTWKWVNGEVVTRPTWGKDQPNNYNGEQNCAVLDGGRGWLWNDVGCNLDYLHWICQYAPANCGSPDRHLLSTVSVTNSKDGGAADYSCPVGHQLVGDRSRNCTLGLWSGEAPTCKYVDCGSPPQLEHGTVELKDSRTTYNASAIYNCHENYTFIGHERRYCGGDGTWGDGAPQCLLDWCAEPPASGGALLNTTGRRAGSITTYTCQSGYILFGQPVLSCGLGGKWSGSAPECRWVECGPAGTLRNGHSSLVNGSTSHGSMVVYTCDEDYWLEGERSATCTAEGKWSSDTPTCELITCLEPEVPPGGYVVGYDFNVRSSIQYHCEAGHVLRGPQQSECQPDGEWSAHAPVCEYVDCGKVPALAFGSASYVNSSTHLGSELGYACAHGYRLQGVPRRYCLDNGQWSDASPKCEEIRCPEPTLAMHSIVSVTGNDRMYGRTLIRTAESLSGNSAGSTYRIGAIAKYRCERGHTLQGEALSTCEDTGIWSGEVPKCTFVDCGPAAPLKHGTVNLASNASYYGAAALYECAPHYKLQGVSRRLCIENGTWSNDAPICAEITCSAPDSPGGAIVSAASLSVGSEATYSCRRGSTLQGNYTRLCNPQGKWTGRPATCKLVECGPLDDIENGRVIIVNGSLQYGANAEYHCIPGHTRVGAYLRKCQEDATWSGEEPTCQVSTGEAQDSGTLGLGIGVAAGVLLFLLMLMGLIYLRLRKAQPVKNTENVEGAERKEDQNAAVMSYATLNDGHQNLYDTPDNLYDETSSSDTYEPEPIRNNVTINGVAVR